MILIYLLFYYFLILDKTCICQLNKALNKPAYMSSYDKDSYAALAVDGNKNGDSYAILDFNEVPSYNWFVVDLIHMSRIKSVYVYNRKCIDCTQALDHFLVGMTNDFKPGVTKSLRGHYDMCGQYPHKALVAGLPMKVICKDDNQLYRFVIIQLNHARLNSNHILGLSEVEVYAKEFFGPNYLGCYQHFNEVVENDLQEMEDCMDYCAIINTIYVAYKWGKCKCGNTLSWTIPNAKCYVGCKKFTLCGGPDAYAVYMVRKPILPRLSVCFNDVRIANHSSIYNQGRFNLHNCIETCSQVHMNYAKVVNKTECICGSSMSRKEWQKANRDQVPCQRTCVKRPDKKCWNPNKIQVYLTCYDDILQKSCQEMYHCKLPSIHNSTGICNKLMCQEGWKGYLCDQRDCSVNNGNCGMKATCSEMRWGLFSITECICGKGFYKRSNHDNCNDIDECHTNQHNCKSPVHTCVNLPGYFKCVVNGKQQNFQLLPNKSEASTRPTTATSTTTTTTTLTTTAALINCINATCHQPSQVCTQVNDEYWCHCATGFEYVNTSYCEEVKTFSLEAYMWRDEVLIFAGCLFAIIFVVITTLLARVLFIQKRALGKIQESLSAIIRQDSINNI